MSDERLQKKSLSSYLANIWSVVNRLIKIEQVVSEGRVWLIENIFCDALLNHSKHEKIDGDSSLAAKCTGGASG